MKKNIIKIVLASLLLIIPLIAVIINNNSYMAEGIVNNLLPPLEYPIQEDYMDNSNEPSTLNNTPDPHLKDEEYDPSPNAKPTTTGIQRSITITSFLENAKCIEVTLNQGDTLSTIAEKYTNTCNPNTTINILKIVNKLDSTDNLGVGDTVLVPHSTLKSGSLYKLSKDNTWYNIWKSKYSQYDQSQLIKFLISINDLPNGNLPIGEKIFLPIL